MSGHARRIFQPSQFKRTMNCPGWGNFCENIPSKPSSIYANEGSAAHYLGERCLVRALPVDHLLGKNITLDDHEGILVKIECTQNMCEAVQVYLDEIHSVRSNLVGATFHVEQKLNLNWLVPGMSGTGDHVAIELLGCIYAHDYKHGQGVAVEVENNPQLMLYGLMAIGEGNPNMVEEIELVVVQPRARHDGGAIRRWRMPVEELLAWGEDVVVPAALAAQKPDAPLHAGEWCKWCPGEGTCPELRKKALESAQVMFDDDVVPLNSEPIQVPKTLSDDQLSKVFSSVGIFKSWIEAVEEEVYSRLNKGVKIAGYKMVHGRLGNRKWTDEKSAASECLKMGVADPYKPVELISPPQMEKALKIAGLKTKEAKAALNPLVSRACGNLTVAPETDARPAVNRLEEMFE